MNISSKPRRKQTLQTSGYGRQLNERVFAFSAAAEFSCLRLEHELTLSHPRPKQGVYRIFEYRNAMILCFNLTLVLVLLGF